MHPENCVLELVFLLYYRYNWRCIYQTVFL